MFFDDILVYSKDKDTHWKDLRAVFELMRDNFMFTKESNAVLLSIKWSTWGIISQLLEWRLTQVKLLQLRSGLFLKMLRSRGAFLGLAGYYRKFVKYYFIISKPLTDLLKKGAFNWSEAASQALSTLKQALVSSYSSCSWCSRFYQAVCCGNRCFQRWHWGCINAKQPPFGFY